MFFVFFSRSLLRVRDKMRQPRRGSVGHAVIEPQNGEAAALRVSVQALKREIEVRVL